MAEFTLYCFAQSGNAYKPALMLSLCDGDWQPRFVDFFNGETDSPEFRALNPMGEVPVLIHRGQRLSQSGVILDYLSAHFGKYGWRNETERREILRWLLFDNHKLTGYIATLRYLLQFAKQPPSPVVEFLRKRADSALRVLDQHLTGRAFVLGERLTIADISMCGYLFWPGEFETDWADYPAIEAWLEKLRAEPGWVHPYELMPGHPLSSS